MKHCKKFPNLSDSFISGNLEGSISMPPLWLWLANCRQIPLFYPDPLLTSHWTGWEMVCTSELIRGWRELVKPGDSWEHGFVQQPESVVSSFRASFNIPMWHKDWRNGSYEWKPNFYRKSSLITWWTECKEVPCILMLTNDLREWKVILVQKGRAALKMLTLKVPAKQQL